ncbi:MAG: alpha-amylase family glycosyl hydrolase, partial [Bacteroidota bacterium]
FGAGSERDRDETQKRSAHGEGSSEPAPDTVAPGEPAVPEWTRGAVWYQIFPERFRNGDPSNDPTIESIRGAYPHTESERLLAAGWQPTPWTHDWYEQEGWAQRLGEPFYTTVQLRRYGGDLQGMLDALPYLDSLGVTALYLNPMNDSPSLHKYDARVYRHIDPHFGPDPEGDKAIIAAEDPLDPDTWQLTAADEQAARGLVPPVVHHAVEHVAEVRADVAHVVRPALPPDLTDEVGVGVDRLDEAVVVAPEAEGHLLGHVEAEAVEAVRGVAVAVGVEPAARHRLDVRDSL